MSGQLSESIALLGSLTTGSSPWTSASIAKYFGALLFGGSGALTIAFREAKDAAGLDAQDIPENVHDVTAGASGLIKADLRPRALSPGFTHWRVVVTGTIGGGVVCGYMPAHSGGGDGVTGEPAGTLSVRDPI